MINNDHIYKDIFSHKEMVEDLLKGFVHLDWVQQANFDTLEKCNNSYVTDDVRERYNDVVWRIKCGNEWLYVYLLLEFQSKPDPYMAVRLLTYVGLLYQDLIKSKQLAANQSPSKTKKLPAVFPLVLYNGQAPWNAAISLRELIQDIPDSLKAYQPDLCYLLIDEARFNYTDLNKLKNLAASLFQLEISTTPPQAGDAIQKLIDALAQPEHSTLITAFVNMLNKNWFEVHLPGQDIKEIQSLGECKTMLAENMRNWTQTWKKEGLEEGREEGREQGIEQGIEQGRKEGIEQGIEQGLNQGEVELLTRQLKIKFGELPEWATTKLNQCTTSQLESLSERIFDVTTLEKFFE